MTDEARIPTNRRLLAIRSLAAQLSLIAGVAFLFFASTSLVRASECAETRMPNTIEIDHTKFVLNGLGIRRATIFGVKVYVGALYVLTRTRSAEKVLSTATAKRLVLHFLRDVDQTEMGVAIEEGIRKNAGEKAESAIKQAKQVTRLFPPLQKGMNLSFTYLPDKGLEIRANDILKGAVKDNPFTQLLFRVWFGPKPPDSGLKSGMLGAKCE
jgi:hypothetical protein